MGTPFKKIFIRSLIEEAIVYREKKYRYYESAFARAVTAESAEVLKNLMTAQLLYRLRLQEVQKKGLPERSRLKEENTRTFRRNPETEHVVPDPWASPDAILDSALVQGENTYRSYKRTSENAHLGSVRELYAYLAHEELLHIQRLKEMRPGKNP
jgi:hypothetical protein